MIDLSKLRTRDGREVRWSERSWCTDLEIAGSNGLGSNWLALCEDSGWAALLVHGEWSTGKDRRPATSREDAQRQAVAYLLSTGELVQAGSAGPTREELLERALRDALYHGDFSEAPDAYTYIEAVLGGENPWADEEAP